MTKSSAPYVAPEGVNSAPESLLSDIPETPAPQRDFDKEPLTTNEKQTLALANLVVKYNALFAACQKMIKRARPANKLKHQYFVLGPDVMDIIAEMDRDVANAWDAEQKDQK